MCAEVSEVSLRPVNRWMRLWTTQHRILLQKQRHLQCVPYHADSPWLKWSVHHPFRWFLLLFLVVMSATNNYKVKLVLSIIEEHFGSITKVRFEQKNFAFDSHDCSSKCVAVEHDLASCPLTHQLTRIKRGCKFLNEIVCCRVCLSNVDISWFFLSNWFDDDFLVYFEI